MEFLSKSEGVAGLPELSFSLLFSGIALGSEDSVASSVEGTVEKLMCSGRTTYNSLSVHYTGGKKNQKKTLSHTQQSWLGVYRVLNCIQTLNLKA